MIFGMPFGSMIPLAFVNLPLAEALEHLERLGVLLQARDRDRAVREDQVGVAAVAEVDERVAPADGRTCGRAPSRTWPSTGR